MKNIKKIALALTLILVPLFVNASEVESVYLNGQIDLMGSMHIKEVHVVKGSISDYSFHLRYKSDIIDEWSEENVNLEGSSFYNGRGIVLSHVSAFKIDSLDEIDWNLLDHSIDDYELVENVENDGKGVYTAEDVEGGKDVKIYTSNEDGYNVYYIDYYVDQIVVTHNDVAEIYYQILPKDSPDIKEYHFQILTPGNSSKDLFKIWAHGPLNGTISPVSTEKDDDGNDLYSGLVGEIKDIKNGTGLDIRIVFDKGLVSLFSQILNNSKMDALDKIIEIENARLDKSNHNRLLTSVIYYGLIALGGIYLLGIIVLGLYIYNRGKNKLASVLYSVLGLIIILLMVLLKAINLPMLVAIAVLDLLFLLYTLVFSNKRLKTEDM